MTYQTLVTPCQATYEIKKSRFLAYAYPITSRDELMFHVEQLKQRHLDARHVCYGYIIGDPNNTTHAGFDDDGEPSGTAGRPILNVLQHKNIGNCAVIVVRYFGGTKLGAGGLTRAYGNTTQSVVQMMKLSEFIAKERLVIITDFAAESQIRHWLATFGGQVIAVDYNKKVRLVIELDSLRKERFLCSLNTLNCSIQPFL